MILPIHNIRYNPGGYPTTSIGVYPSEKDRNWSNGTHYIANCQQIRKDVAIASNEDYLFLVRIVQENSWETRYIDVKKYYGIIIFQKDTRQFFGSDSHIYQLYRTIKGYYVFTDTYSKSRCIPGKDDEYEVTDITVFDENGVIDNKWESKNIGYGEIPIEVAKGLIVHNNVFYDLDSLKEVFRIPSKYVLNGCYIDGLLHLTIPEDKRTLYVLVKDKHIVCKFSEKDLASKIEELSDQEKKIIDKVSSYNILPSVNYAKCEKWLQSYSARVFYGEIRDSIRNDETGYILTIQEANALNNECSQKINHKVNKIINQLRHFLFERNRNKSFIPKLDYNPIFRLSPTISCYINKYFTFLCHYSCDNNQRSLVFSIYDITGHRLSNNNFINIVNPDLNSSIHGADNIYGIYQAVNYDTKQKVVFGYANRAYFETIIPKECELYATANGFCYIINKWENAFYDVFMNPIKIEYVICSVIPEINKYLYVIEPNFYPNSQNFTYGTSVKVGDSEWVTVYPKPSAGYYNGKLCLPYPFSFKTAIQEMEARNKNRPNYITQINKLRTFYLEDGPVSIYRFVCEPWAYCDLSGKIINNFNADNIIL